MSISKTAFVCEAAGCVRRADHTCDWPVEVQVQTCAVRLKVGDVWVTERGQKRGKIVEINLWGSQGRRVEVLREASLFEFWVLIPGHSQPYPYKRPRWGGRPIYTLAMAPCGQFACDEHHVERSEIRHYCAAHWRAWERV